MLQQFLIIDGQSERPGETWERTHRIANWLPQEDCVVMVACEKNLCVLHDPLVFVVVYSTSG